MPLSNILSRKVIIPSVGIMMMPIGASIVYNYLSYFIQTSLHIYTYELSSILLIYGLVSIIGTWIGGKLIYYKDKLTLLVFQIVCIIVFAAIYEFWTLLIPTLILIFIFGLLDGIGYNLIQYIESSVLPDTPELANGIFLSNVNGGIAIGIAIGGFLVNYFGVLSIFPSGIIFITMAFILIYYSINIMHINLKYS